ncbi:hypothetical protein XCR1_1140020 [Xenorhabdus cabanillasii JM26]|uniref:Uncharacterized protein n=2 Tax=Xenorhabdus cabanillasii TaxID=351673 RepID=A0A3D9UHF3_9GAMM|nr:hypothetical protein Xcab_01201 [Xenorhabdus cabanillasii JM26]REF28908.1 hypothetical protein BDD26_3877 [Xenorhabdus cabanillasii]CDL79444.1 hypothetical protein XCR1_1140020 [Xenorhabdus cabanillasii JM26]
MINEILTRLGFIYHLIPLLQPSNRLSSNKAPLQHELINEC